MVHGVTSFLVSVELVAEGATGGLSTITKKAGCLPALVFPRPYGGSLCWGPCVSAGASVWFTPRAGGHPIVSLCMAGERVARETGIGWRGDLEAGFPTEVPSVDVLRTDDHVLQM